MKAKSDTLLLHNAWHITRVVSWQTFATGEALSESVYHMCLSWAQKSEPPLSSLPFPCLFLLWQGDPKKYDMFLPRVSADLPSLIFRGPGPVLSWSCNGR